MPEDQNMDPSGDQELQPGGSPAAPPEAAASPDESKGGEIDDGMDAEQKTTEMSACGTNGHRCGCKAAVLAMPDAGG